MLIFLAIYTWIKHYIIINLISTIDIFGIVFKYHAGLWFVFKNFIAVISDIFLNHIFDNYMTFS